MSASRQGGLRPHEGRRIDGSAVVARSPAHVSCELDGEVVLLSIDRGKYYGMDAIASRIWDLIARPRAVADVCRELTRRYEVSQEECLRDVLSLLDELSREGLIEVSNSAGAGARDVGLA